MPFYNSLRTNLRTDVLSIVSRNELNLELSSNLLLHVNDTLPYQDNRDILLATDALTTQFPHKAWVDPSAVPHNNNYALAKSPTQSLNNMVIYYFILSLEVECSGQQTRSLTFEILKPPVSCEE